MISRIVVVVPANDEQDEIGGCLAALARSRRELEISTAGRVRADVVVVLDDCRDGTAAVAAGFADVRTVSCVAGRVGTARRVGVAWALADLDHRPVEQVWIANTDADSRVPPDWLVRMLAHAERGAHLVLGTVLPAPGLDEHAWRAWHTAHRLHDGHPHVHGANLGVNATAYLQLGGWADLASHEDVDLVARAGSTEGMCIRRCGDLPVTTSVRRAGRAPHGFAGYLGGLDAALPGAG